MLHYKNPMTMGFLCLFITRAYSQWMGSLKIDRGWSLNYYKFKHLNK